MFVVRVELRQSTIHGFGCFAVEPIRKGQPVWRFDPRLDILIPFDEYDSFSPPVQDMLKHMTYTEERDGVDYMVLCGDHARFMNHSSDPNVVDSEDMLEDFAARDIEAGEELTCNYFTFDKHAGLKVGGSPTRSKG